MAGTLLVALEPVNAYMARQTVPSVHITLAVVARIRARQRTVRAIQAVVTCDTVACLLVALLAAGLAF